MKQSTKRSEKRPWSDTFLVAFEGIRYGIRTQRNLKVHLSVALIVIIVGFVTEINQSEWLWIGLCITLVFMAELINTALEATVNLVTSEWHPLAKAAKDTAAGAVLVAVIFSVIVGLIIFANPLMAILKQLLYT